MLDDTRVRAEYAAARAKLAAYLARGARLEAEQAGTEEPSFPAELLAQAGEEPPTEQLLRAERESLVAQRRALADQIAVRDGQIAQATSELTAYGASLVSIDRQLELIDEEIATVQDLLIRGLDRKPRLLGLQRARAALDGERTAAIGSAARTRELIVATAAERAALISGRADEVATGLAETRAAANELQAAVRASRDMLERSTIRAPVAGEVVDLRVRTVGGVLGAGEPILDLVPRDEPLVLEARISPQDIDVVHPGLTAVVHLLAFHTRNMTRIQGVVRKVSGDRLVDPKTAEPYYTAQIVLDMAALRKQAPDIHLTAGMPAEAMIVTGERTMLQYIIEPIRSSFRRALRES